MSDLLVQGLEVSLLGMGMTIAALGLLIVTMVLLERLFQPTSPLEEERRPVLTASTNEVSEEEEIAAAIAVALAYFGCDESARDALGATLEQERGLWWHRGQRMVSGRDTKRRGKRQRHDG